MPYFIRENGYLGVFRVVFMELDKISSICPYIMQKWALGSATQKFNKPR